ncbi:MAG TPA: polymer-forming cytoskeletal protein [Actinomycetota bacterium]|nr:polymer-forming cytoskeletal protein [Actinomycetota bacterium]
MPANRARSSIVVAAAAFAALGVLAPGAAAQDDDGPDTDDQIVITGSLVVPEGETVQHAVIFNGGATIEGTVARSLVVFNGRTEILGTVADDVVVFNGDVILRSGSRVGGDVVSLQTPQIEEGATVGGSVDDLQGRWDYWDATFVGRLAWWLAFTVSTLVLGMVLLLLAARGLDAIAIRALRERLGPTIGSGLLVFLALPVVAVLLFVTIVGIPLGLFLLLGLALIYSIGYVIGALALGRLVVKPPTSRYVAFLAGWGALRVLALIPFLGGVVWFVATVIGLGTLWVGARARRTGEVAPASVPPMPAEG